MGKEYVSSRELYENLGVANADPETKMNAIMDYLGADKAFITPGQGSAPLGVMERLMGSPKVLRDLDKFLLRTGREPLEKKAS